MTSTNTGNIWALGLFLSTKQNKTCCPSGENRKITSFGYNSKHGVGNMVVLKVKYWANSSTANWAMS